MSHSTRRTWIGSSIAMLAAAVWFPCAARGQTQGQQPPKSASGAMAGNMVGMADHAMTSMTMDSVTRLHMQMTPMRPATHADTVRAFAVVNELRHAIEKYQDVSVAEHDGFKMFLPNVKNQRVFHFTNYRNAFKERFRFNAEEPTSLLYRRGADGSMVLIGAMYTMPKGASPEQLDERVPLGIGQWHKHVNWCLPKRGEGARFMERRDGRPVFGPESPIATKEACDAVGGNFYPSPFGWMIHANVFSGQTLGAIFGDEHMEHGGN